MFKSILLLVAGVMLAGLYGCKEPIIDPGVINKNTLVMNVQRLEDLGPNARYEGWIIVNSSPVSTGVFTVDGQGRMSKNQFEVDPINLNIATKVIVTIEPVPDPSPEPSMVKLVAGDFNGNTAQLTMSHPDALNTDFASATGKYILATPTDGPNTNELSGVWFIDNMMPGLDLPTLPSGWVYEGWAVINGTPVTTGKFTSVNMADQMAPYSGSQPGPPFPGEDFLMNAPAGLVFPTNLQQQQIVITVEPNPDNSTTPFSLKPLKDNVPSDLETMEVRAMVNQSAATNAIGSATRQ